MRLVATLAAMTFIVSCTDVIHVRTYPPGALFTANDTYSCNPPCDLRMRAPSTLRYTVTKPGYVPAEGEIKSLVAPGRVVGAIFTLGILALGRSIFYYPPESIITVRPAVDPAAELRPLPRMGTGRVEGQAFTKTLGGELRYAAGNTIGIRPDTTYVRDGVIFLAYTDSGINVLSSNPDLSFLETWVRKTTGDGEGRFAFENLPAGKYVFSATITWRVAMRDGLDGQQVEVVGEAEVKEGETARVIVTDVIEPEFRPRRSRQRGR